MRGYFGVGIDGVSKPMNLGNLSRIANAFEASFFFTVNAHVKLADAQSDTSRAQQVLPYYAFHDIEEFRLPVGCRLVGVEITDDATELPRFRHPERAAYVAKGQVMVEGRSFAAGQMIVFGPGAARLETGAEAARVMLLGGAPVGPRHIWWNFVSSSEARIEEAKAAWRAGRMALPPSDAGEFIPLPD